jgi:hypothetical protein
MALTDWQQFAKAAMGEMARLSDAGVVHALTPPPRVGH